jgi:hypothetical protein
MVPAIAARTWARRSGVPAPAAMAVLAVASAGAVKRRPISTIARKQPTVAVIIAR